MLRWMLAALLLIVALVMLAGMPQTPASKSAPVLSAVADLSHVQGQNTISADLINQVLMAAGSPAAGLGQEVYNLSAQYGFDDAYVLGFFGHESSFGTRGVATATHSWGNIIGTPGYACLGRFRSYPTWRDGLIDFLLLLAHEYVAHGLVTLNQIIPVYAPSSDGNSVSAYIQAVQSFVSAWRQGKVQI